MTTSTASSPASPASTAGWGRCWTRWSTGSRSLAGVVVCWKFELLPRWALAILAAREVVTVIVAQVGLRRGLDLEINWVGRWSVWLTMGGIFLALVTAAWIAPAMFFAGLVGSLLASALYLQTGLAAMRRQEK